MTLGYRISKSREDQALTQDELALDLGVTRDDIYMWESDREKPSTDQLAVLSYVLGVPTDYLLFGDGLDSEMAARAAAASNVSGGKANDLSNTSSGGTPLTPEERDREIAKSWIRVNRSVTDWNTKRYFYTVAACMFIAFGLGIILFMLIFAWAWGTGGDNFFELAVIKQIWHVLTHDWERIGFFIGCGLVAIGIVIARHIRHMFDFGIDPDE